MEIVTEKSLVNFADQFNYEPIIANASSLSQKDGFILAGMGGSHLAASLIKAYDPFYPVLIHWDYGLPKIKSQKLKDYLFIANSYSGNTLETIDALVKAKDQGLPLAVITSDGRLLALAEEYALPYIKIPDWGLAPREGLGLSLRALLAMIGDQTMLEETKNLSRNLKPDSFEAPGKQLAEEINGFIPIIYSSRDNSALAYIWKIKMNETAKMPAFYNIFPELNHNEIEGFRLKKSSSEKFKFIFIIDEADQPEIKRQMMTSQQILKEQGQTIKMVVLTDGNRWEKLFNNIILASWTTHYIALRNNDDPQETPLINHFKNRLLTGVDEN